MSEFGTTLTALFDEVASTIDPRPDFEAVLRGEGMHVAPAVPIGRRPIGQLLGFAAASAMILGGAAFVLGNLFGDDEGQVATSDVVSPPRPFDLPGAAPSDEATSTTLAKTGNGEPHTPRTPDKVLVPVVVEPKPPTATDAPADTTSTLPRPYNAQLGYGNLALDPIRQVVYGTSPAGAKVVVTTPWGTEEAHADRRGEWWVVLELKGLPGGTVIPISVGFDTSPDTKFAFELVRPPDTVPVTTEKPALPPTTEKPVETAAPKVEPRAEPKPEPTPEPEPTPIEFTADLGSADLASSPMKQFFYGTGTPGSVVRAESAYGSAEATVGEKGYWEFKLKMYEVPVGTAVGVRIVNSASSNVYEFSLVRQSPPPPPEIEFSANAAFSSCDAATPYNEYWGKSTPGATITISSPYGSGQATSNGDGKWSARVEFPGAPIGETFTVTITSSKSGAAYQFQMVSTRAGEDSGPAGQTLLEARWASVEAKRRPASSEAARPKAPAAPM